MFGKIAWNRITLIVLALGTLLILSVGAVGAGGNGATIDQCANGNPLDPNACRTGALAGDDWINGNLNSNKSMYREGQSVPFRLLLNTTVTDIQLNIQWQALNAVDKHPYDYITSFDRTVGSADPCLGVTGCSGAPTTVAIPDDPAAPQHCGLPGGSQVPGVLSIWNGTLTAPTSADYFQQSCFPVSTNGFQSLTLRIHVPNPALNVVIAWGGHIGTQLDWGEGKDAAAVSGSPYHMILDSTSCGPAPFTCTGKNLQLQNAVLLPPAFSTQRSTPVGVGIPIHDDATLTGTAAQGGPAGTVQFSWCYNFSHTVFPDCNLGSTLLGSPVPVVVTGNNGTATSPIFTTTLNGDKAGLYCFRAVYIPDPSSLYSAAIHTNQSTAVAGGGECFDISSPTSVTLESFSANSADGNGWLAVGLLLLGSALVAGFVYARARR